MADKDYTFILTVPLCLKEDVDIQSFDCGIKSISFHVDLEKNLCHIYSRNNHFRTFLHTVYDFNFKFLQGCLNGLQKKNEEKLVSEKFPKRSRCKES